MLLETPTVIGVPPYEQAAPVGTPPTPGSPMGFATPPQVGTTRPRPLSNNLPSGEHTRARLLSPREPMMAGSGSITAQVTAQEDNDSSAVVIQTAARAFLACRRRRRAAAARKIQAAARARQALLLEAFVHSLVFFPELGDIAFYGW